MKSSSRLVALLMVGVLASGLAFAAGGRTEPTTPTTEEEEKSPEQLATEYYNSGVASRNRAWKLEKKLETAPLEKRKKMESKIVKAYQSSADYMTRAVQANPKHFQALSDLGYANRKLGNFEFALQAYNEALSIKPDYANAIEYRAEAYLALGRIEEAKQAYVTLFQSDRKLADQLLESMKKYAKEREGTDAATLESFKSWIEEREQIAQQTAMHFSSKPDRGW